MGEAPNEGETSADEWTPERRRAFTAALAERQARQLLAGRLTAALLLVTVGGGVLLRAPESWWVPAAGAIAILALGYRLANWKCPSCGAGLPLRRQTSLCLGCGAPLE